VEGSDLITLVGCNFRFQPGIRKLKELLQEDVVGTPLSAQIEAGSYLPNWHPEENYREMYSVDPEMGGGVILDYIHELNYCRWLFGKVEEVTAMVSSRSHLNIDVEDLAELVLRMEDGTLCEIHLDYVQQPDSRSCKIIGDEGTLEWNLDDHAVKEYQPERGKWKTHDLPEWKTNEMYVDELDHFFSCVESRCETICGLKSGFKDLQVALSALRSAESGKCITLDSI
jgi:predicted dehydrogenase